jgi:hydrogenase nickel incorporation protein HypA/HybF
MHEMSLVISILDIAETQARAADARVINRIIVEVGALAGVENDALTFCFTAARLDTMAANGELEIREIAGWGTCPACGLDGPASDFVAVCSLCDEGVLQIKQGRELRVSSINVD